MFFRNIMYSNLGCFFFKLSSSLCVELRVSLFVYVCDLKVLCLRFYGKDVTPEKRVFEKEIFKYMLFDLVLKKMWHLTKD